MKRLGGDLKVVKHADRSVNGSNSSSDRSRRPTPKVESDELRVPYEWSKGYSDCESCDEIRPRYHDKLRPAQVGWTESSWPHREEARVKRFEMKPPSFGGKCSVRTFLAKFDNCALHNGWTANEKRHYLTNCLEDPVGQIV